jgi:thiol-disulfide isomerase/thioredoxin
VKGTPVLIALGIVVAAAAIWAGVRRGQAVGSFPANNPPGEHAAVRFFRNPVAVKPFTVHDLDGRSLSSTDWHGKVVLVNFWATWCGPCRAEIPDLVALQQKYRDHLQIIGVSEDEGPIDPVKRFAADRRVNYPVVMLTPELEKIFGGINALPTTFVLDREGRLVQKHVGLLTPAVTELETQVLAGLAPEVRIEQIDRAQPMKLENAAQATSIPGVDLARLSPDRRAEALKRLNEEPCTCGCDLMVARCRIEDPTCGISLPIARRIVAEIDSAHK